MIKCPPIKKSSENEKNINDTEKIKDKEVNVFVINLKKHADRWKKYKGNPNYKRFPAVIGADLPADNEYLKGKMIMMWNASDKQRRNVVGCYLSHLNLLKKMTIYEGISMIFVTHDLAVAKFISSKLLVLKNGTMIELNHADSLIKSPKDSYTKELLESVPQTPKYGEKYAS